MSENRYRDMPPADAIRAHRDFLLQNRWVQDDPHDSCKPQGTGCLLVAIDENCHPHSLFSAANGAYDAIQHALLALHPDDPSIQGAAVEAVEAAAWNDKDAQGLDEVIEVLEYAEKLVRDGRVQ